MVQARTVREGLRRRRADSATFAAIAPGAPFLSQLLAGASAPPRLGQVAPEGAAAGAYASAQARTVRRLPPGYRTAIDT